MKNQTPTKRWGYLVFPSISIWGVRTLWVLMSGGELKIVSFQNCHEIASWTKMEFLTLCQSFGEQQKPNLLTWTSSSQQILWVDDNAIFWVISSAQSKSFLEIFYFCLKGDTLYWLDYDATLLLFFCLFYWTVMIALQISKVFFKNQTNSN